MSSDQSKEVVEDSSSEAQLPGGCQEFSSSRLVEVNNKTKLSASLRGSTLTAIVQGIMSFDKLVEIAKAEFKIDNSQAVSQVLSMIKVWQSLKGGNELNSSDLDSSRIKEIPLNRIGDSNIRTASLCGQLGSPLSELKQLRSCQIGSDSKREASTLDSQLWLLTHSNRDEQLPRVSLENKDREGPVAVSPSVSIIDPQSTLTGTRENDVEQTYEIDNLTDSMNVSEEDIDYNNITNKILIPVDQMSVGQRMSREVILREISSKDCNTGVIDVWDPLAYSLDNNEKSRMIKEIEQEQNFIPLAGTLAPPIRSKGQGLFNRDNALCRILEDVNIMVKGTAQSMALTLDNRGDEAVKRSAKVVALGANVMSRLNAERIRIHYPKEFANKILRPVTEPIMREIHRTRARVLVQDVKNQNTLVGPLFRKGGRGAREGARAKLWKSNRFPFPRNGVQNRFRKYNNIKSRKGHVQSNKQQASNLAN
jgi:hypothetical protein